MKRIVVVGAGLAGANVSEALRGEGYDGELILVGGERHLPYDRPPLSKGVLAAPENHAALPFDYAALDVELCLGQRAVALRPYRLELADGQALTYDRLVIATGSTAMRLPGTEGVDGSVQLRDIEDAERLGERLRKGNRVVVVGAGWIGAEVSTAARAFGCEVTVVEAGVAPSAGVLGPEIGALLGRWYARAGIDLRVRTQVRSVVGRPDGSTSVRLSTGEELIADTVVVGVGARPTVDWLSGSAVQVDRAVVADERLRTTAPDVFAAGDVASWPSARFARRMHVEHWDNALQSAECVAKNVLGAEQHYDPVPYFWTEQFGHMLQYVGVHGHDDEVVWRGDPQDPDEAWTALWVRDRTVTAALTLNRPRDSVVARKIIESAPQVDVAELANTDEPLSRFREQRREKVPDVVGDIGRSSNSHHAEVQGGLT